MGRANLLSFPIVEKGEENKKEEEGYYDRNGVSLFNL